MGIPQFSRHLPPAPKTSAVLAGWVVLTGIAAGYAIWVIDDPGQALFAGAALVIVSLAATLCDHRRKGLLAKARPGNPLCRFARSFDLRSIDPWVVRATFEELQSYFANHLRPFPLRPEDHLIDDIAMEAEDIGPVADIIAMRAGRSFENLEQNPYFARVRTVEDLVLFLNSQPRVRDI